MWKVLPNVIESIIAASQNTFPNEFVSLLGGNTPKKIVDELIVVPAISGKAHAILRTDLLPLNQPVVGSVHSHPGYSNRPSSADAHLFARYGPFHLIICQPFSLSKMQAFDITASPISFEILGKEHQ